jgi:O-antigen/teichoic acid export membrane protein
MDLRQKTMIGLGWSTIAQVVKQASQFLITAVLARLLAPTDFGLIGMAAVFVNFVSIFNEFGLSAALIQKKDAEQRHYSSAFWLNVMAGLCLTLILVAFSPVVADFYHKPELTAILAALSFNFFLSSFTIIQQTMLTRDMDFRSLMIRDIASVIIAGAVGIFCAYQGWGVWSLIVQALTLTAVNAVT